MRGLGASTAWQASTRSGSSRASGFAPWAALAAALLASSCGAPAERPADGELETAELPPAIDAGISLADDVQARPVGKRVAGVMPSEFPGDFPVYSPAAVVDFGPGFVELTSTDSRAAVEAGIGAAARAAGWQAQGGGRYRKGGRSVSVSLGSISGVTTIRLEYT
jgi:hypothetical protein